MTIAESKMTAESLVHSVLCSPSTQLATGQLSCKRWTVCDTSARNRMGKYQRPRWSCS